MSSAATPFPDEQIRKVAEIAAEQLTGLSNRRSLSAVTGAGGLPLASQMDRLHRHQEVDRVAGALQISWEELTTDLFNDIKKAIEQPRDFGSNAYRENGQLTGFNIHTNSRGGFTPVLKHMLEKYQIPHGYGELPSIDIFCYSDGHIAFQDRSKETVEDITYPGFTPKYKRTSANELSKLTGLDITYIKSPNPFLTKQVPVGTVVGHITDGQVLTDDMWSRPVQEGWQTIILKPTDYKPGLTADLIDTNDPRIINRSSMCDENRDFGEKVRDWRYDVVQKDGLFYPKPVAIKPVPEPMMISDGEKRILLKPGEYFSISKGLNGNEETYKTVKTHTAAEIQALLDSGVAVRCDEQGKTIEGAKVWASSLGPRTGFTPSRAGDSA